MPGYVLDTSAILTVLNGEPGQEVVQQILRQAGTEETPGATVIWLPFMALMETEYWSLRRLSPEEVDSMIAIVLGWPAQVVESNPDWRRQAATMKASGRLSIADAWIASLALSLGASLVHRDREFDRIDGLRAVRLPS